MGQTKKDPVTVEKLAENLSLFAIDRTDLKELIKTLPPGHELNVTTLEYELQLLRILSVGWALSFFMPDSETKKNLTLLFWETIREIAKNISNLTETTTGQPIDYFGILKQRMDTYLGMMQQQAKEVPDPAAIIGPVFADACGAPEDAVAVLTGTKMFNMCLSSVKEYIAIVEITGS